MFIYIIIIKMKAKQNIGITNLSEILMSIITKLSTLSKI